MSGNCTEELNKQIQGLSARVSEAENNITSHFMATSMAIQGLLANPFTAGSVMSVSGLYNLVPGGFEALQSLVSQVAAFDYKKIMMSMAAGLINQMSAELDALAQSAIDQVTSQVANLTNMIATLEGTIVGLEDMVTNAIKGGIQSEIDAAKKKLADAQSMIDRLKETKLNLEDGKPLSVEFLLSQSNIAKCLSGSMVIG
jgi:hypothetical protein